MPIPRQLCVVEDMFFIKGRGLVITTGRWQGGSLRPGDWIDLHSSTGERNSAEIKSIEGVRFIPGQPHIVDAHHFGGLLLADISRDTFHTGDQIWSTGGTNKKETF